MKLSLIVFTLIVCYHSSFSQSTSDNTYQPKFGISVAPLGLYNTIRSEKYDTYNNPSDVVSNFTIDLTYQLNSKIGVRTGIEQCYEYRIWNNGKNTLTYGSDTSKRTMFSLGMYRNLNKNNRKVYPKISTLIAIGRESKVRNYRTLEPNPDPNDVLYPQVAVRNRDSDNNIRVEFDLLFGLEWTISKRIALSSDLGIDFGVIRGQEFNTKKSSEYIRINTQRLLMVKFNF